MYRLLNYNKYILLAIVTLALSSCKTTAPRLNFQDLAHAAVTLDMDIDLHDNHQLYIESAKWIGVPYRYGGNSRRGIDCSGLTRAIYKKVYHKTLKRNSDEQRTDNCQRVAKRNLREGDLVFFRNGRRERKANHVGIYLKNGRFIHASSSEGVIVSSLNEPYYKKCWMQGGRVRKHK